MENLSEIANAALLIGGAFVALISAVYTLFLLIPGDQPDKTIKAFLDFTQRFSRK
jgi:hypothetical protein